MRERIWLTWERQRRNRTLSVALDAELYELHYPLPRLRRWTAAISGTLRILWRERPQVVFAQNPSLILALLAAWYGRLCGRITVIDAHNAGVYPFFERKSWHARLLRPLMQRLVHHVMRTADLTLVSNASLQAYVESVGGRAFVLPDPLPRFPGFARPASVEGDGCRVLFICTWAADEPYLEVIAAAVRLDPGIQVLITGNSKGREQAYGQPLPPNVTLTGYLPEDEFVHLLHAVDVVMDLTILQDCLVCGAYEAVAAGTPLILSDTRALREYFRRGVVFTANRAEAIAAAIERALAERQRLATEIAALKLELEDGWQRQREQLEAWIGAQAARVVTAADRKL